MTKTENYQLPQWGAEDPVRTGDLNGAMAGIDGALAEAGAALAEEQTAREQADAALQAEVDSVRTTAETRKVVVGLYTGNGSSQTITLGFAPRAVYITDVCHPVKSIACSTLYCKEMGLYDFKVTTTGFMVVGGENLEAKLNESGRRYLYAAFRN